MTNTTTAHRIAAITVTRNDNGNGIYAYGANATNASGGVEFFTTQPAAVVTDDSYHGDVALQVAEHFGLDVDLDDLEYKWINDTDVKFWL